jgi:transposase-like protein
MTMTAEKFRELAALRKVPGANTGARYSTAERRWAVEYARQPGMSANRAARALGISDVTMRIWIRAERGVQAGSGYCRPGAHRWHSMQ